MDPSELNHLSWREILKFYGLECKVCTPVAELARRGARGLLKVSMRLIGGIKLEHPGLPCGKYEVPESSLDFTPINFGIWFS